MSLSSTPIQVWPLIRRHALVLLLIVAYGLWYVRLYPALGPVASMPAVIPAIVGAGLFGWKVGLLYMLGIAGLTVGLHNSFAPISGLGLLTSLPGGLALFLVSLVIGLLHDLNVRLQRELAERRRVETRLSLTAAALQQTDRRFRLLVEKSAEAIYSFDPKTLRLYEANSAFRELLGYAAEEVPRLTLHDFVAESPQEIQPNLQKVFELGGLDIGERQWRRTDGRLVDVSVSVSMVQQDDEEVVFVVGRDITARKQADAALREAEANFRTLVEQLPAITYRAALNETRSTMYVSPQIMTLGYAPSEYLADPELWRKLIHPADRARVVSEVALMGASGKPLRSEYRALDRTGQQFWLRDEAVVVYDDAGRPLFVQGILLDITERILGETKLANSERQLRTIIEAEHECIKIVAEGGVVEMMNPAGLAMLEADSPDQVIGTIVFRFIAPEDVDGYRTFAERVLQGETGTLEYQVIGLKGTRRWLESYAVPLSKANGHGATLLAVTRDMTERKLAESHIRRQFQRMAALRAIDQAITGSLDLDLTLTVFLEQLLTHLGVHAADVMLVDARDGMLTYTAGRGFRSGAFQQTRLRLGEGRAGRAALERRIVVETEGSQTQQPSFRTGLLGRENFVSYFGVPLIAKGEVLGVLEIFHRARLEPDTEWLEFLEALASQAAIAIDNASLFEGLQNTHQKLLNAYDATIEGWSRALDLRDKETEGHSRRVTDLTLRLAQAQGMDADHLAHIRRGALLHDIGKLGIPDRILFKAEPLTEEEWVIMRQHPTFANELLAPIAFLQPALAIPYCHHEKWDGTGYPRGLKGEQIPLPARLFAVVDVWDALRSDRSYRTAWPTERVLEHIRFLSGSHFDPHAVDVFMQLVEAH
jgi:PAS domain S-box-containing protein